MTACTPQLGFTETNSTTKKIYNFFFSPCWAVSFGLVCTAWVTRQLHKQVCYHSSREDRDTVSRETLKPELPKNKSHHYTPLPQVLFAISYKLLQVVKDSTSFWSGASETRIITDLEYNIIYLLHLAKTPQGQLCTIQQETELTVLPSRK